MIWCRFQSETGPAYAIVEGDTVVPVKGDPFGQYERSSATQPLASTKLLVPVIPGNFHCGGLNYADHIARMSRQMGISFPTPDTPLVSQRSNSALIATEENIIKPKDSGTQFQYEAELVAVIGKTIKHATRDQARDAIFGWTIGNDVSERDWQTVDKTIWRSKNADTFKPMGPWIVTDPDLAAMETIIRINGREAERFVTANMLFDAIDFICELTRYCTLHPGDVLWLGTDGEPENMAPGDTVELELTGIGVLRNPVVLEA